MRRSLILQGKYRPVPSRPGVQAPIPFEECYRVRGVRESLSSLPGGHAQAGYHDMDLVWSMPGPPGTTHG